MGKRDVISAVNLFPVHPDKFDLIGGKFDDKYCSVSLAFFGKKNNTPSLGCFSICKLVELTPLFR
jgi:hypothetical protein